MSLDLYLKSKDPVKKEGTGIFVRDNGQTRELSLEEAREKYPDASIELQSYEDDTLWHGNITHNLCKMAEHVIIEEHTLYQLLWHPGDFGFHTTTEKYKQLIYLGFYYMLLHRKELEEFNPSNGWGSYGTFLDFLYSYCEYLSKCDELEIEVSI